MSQSLDIIYSRSSLNKRIRAFGEFVRMPSRALFSNKNQKVLFIVVYRRQLMTYCRTRLGFGKLSLGKVFEKIS